MAVSKGPSPGAHEMSSILFLAISSHDGTASGMCYKPDISEQVIFQDSAFLNGVHKINKNMTYMDNTYML